MNTLRRWVSLMTHHPWRRLAVIFGLSALLVLALGVAAFTGVRTASADTSGGCNNSNSNPQTSDHVGIDVSTSVNTATYKFISFFDENSSGGIPGLIEYCVYPSPSTQPDSVTPQAVGLCGTAWTDPSQQPFDHFSFDRPDGDPCNIPLDGKTTTMGTATWSGGVPAGQKILLHINFPAECSRLYGAGTLTCFVLPGTQQQQAKDLTVTKTATPLFTRTYGWTISKSVDQTVIKQSGTTATFNYTVSVTHDSGTDSGWQVTGTITVSNPNTQDFAGVNVTDAVDNGGTCNVTGGSNVTVPASGHVDLPYTCTYTAAPTPSSGTNTATATWDSTTYNTPDSKASGTHIFDFSLVSPTVKDNCVDVSDPIDPNSPHHFCVGDPGDPTFTFTYSHDVTGTAGTCVTQDNTATFTTNDTGTTGSDGKTVKLCVGADLTVSKTATPSFTRTYNWDIKKSVDKTLVEQIGGGTATFNYTVNVSETGFKDSDWQVTGKITVTNPNDWEAITADVSDAVDNGGTCNVSSGSGVSVPASSSVTLDYTCTYGSAPSPSSGTNTATATWDSKAFFTPDNLASGTAGFTFSAPTKTVNQTITVTDTFNSTTTTLGTLTATDAQPFASATFTYPRTVNVPTNNCLKYTNTAKIVETGQSASQTIEVCGPAKTGALTMGFWQNTNGQSIIKNGASTAGVCNSGAWLRQYAPFQDLSATATCSQVATYVTNVIKVATCSGSTCNAMLKAQMLATALDVYFSDPALGGNKIGAPAPIGGVTIDLNKICTDIPTCTTFVNVSPAFGGATSLTVSQMLSYAASQSSAGGTPWYGQVKATQVLAKDAFDAINNQLAFAP